MKNVEGVLIEVAGCRTGRVVRELLVKAGTRKAIDTIIVQGVEKLLTQIGLHFVKKSATHLLPGSLPLIGALCAASFAYYDTLQVGKSANNLFSGVNS